MPFLILDCNAPAVVISSWLQQRQAHAEDPSDATQAVIDAQQAGREPLSEAELLQTRRVETNESGSLDKLVEQIRQRLPGL